MPKDIQNPQIVRVIHIVFILSLLLYIFLVIPMLQITPKAVNPVIVGGLALAVVSELSVRPYLQKSLLVLAEARLRRDPNDLQARRIWFTGHLLNFCMAESIGLFGVVLKILGAPWSIAGIFFAVSLLLLLYWTPRWVPAR